MTVLTKLPSALSLVLKTIPKFLVVETVGRVWVLGGSDEMGGMTNGKVLAFGGVEVQLPVSGPASTAV